MRKVQVEIKSLSGLLMHRFGEAEQAKVAEGGGTITVPDAREKAAESAAYRLVSNGKAGNLYVPAENLRRSLVSAATYEKAKGRGSLAKFAAAAIFVSPDVLDLGTSKYEIDSRPVVIPATKGRVIRHRPMLPKWALEFTVEYDETLLNEAQLRRIVDHAGSKVGLLDYRPEKRGPFGRFMVTEWKS